MKDPVPLTPRELGASLWTWPRTELHGLRLRSSVVDG